ncbi:MAG: hypothetical protein COA79_17990 [Planctomycetota bacterium]|nr:MAG: hypothetical protein COA79_17990 [Planctomycetota bacterium]
MNISNYPNELIEFLSKRESLNNSELSIQILSIEESVEYSVKLSGIAAFESLCLLPIEDSENSNPYCYVNNGPLKGAIIYLSHDDSAKVMCESIKSFETALNLIIKNGEYFDEIENYFQTISKTYNLDFEINSLLNMPEEFEDIVEFQICIYIPLIEINNISLLDSIANYDNMFIQEALIQQIKKAPLKEHLNLATLLGANPNPQVSDVAKDALIAIQNL